MADDVLPFGVGGPAEPQVEHKLVGNLAGAIAGIPAHLYGGIKNLVDAAKISAAQNYGPGIQSETDVDPLPAQAASMAAMLAGGGAPAAEAGAAGIFGGKLAKTANMDKLEQAERMIGKGQDRGITRQITGWFQGPDKQWRFEIPDERSRMMYPNGAGPAATMLQHEELFKAYPQLRDVKAHSEVNPNFPSDTGLWNLNNNMIEVSSRNPEQARAGMLHELQHGIQHIEGFTPGTTSTAYEEALKHAPEELKKAVGTVDPYEMYWRTAGEVEPRNVETRRDYNPQQRHDYHPWETHDTEYNKQLLIPALEESKYPLLKVLREKK